MCYESFSTKNRWIVKYRNHYMHQNKINKLNEFLLDSLLADLNDPQKCTPGLYQVIRGYLNDNIDLLDSIPKEALESLGYKLSDSIPFKKEAS